MFFYLIFLRMCKSSTNRFRCNAILILPRQKGEVLPTAEKIPHVSSFSVDCKCPVSTLSAAMFSEVGTSGYGEAVNARGRGRGVRGRGRGDPRRGRGGQSRGRGIEHGVKVGTATPMNVDFSGHDLSKEEANKIHCDICQIFCVGPEPFKTHLQGSRHKRNEERAAQGEPPVKGKSGNSRSAGKGKIRIQDSIDECAEPLIGLEMVTEHTMEDPEVDAVYICEMCEAKCSSNAVIPHVLGYKHRSKYFERESPEKYKEIMSQGKVLEGEKMMNKPKSELSEIMSNAAKEWEASKGRRRMKVKKELQPFYNPNAKNEQVAIIAKLERKVALLEKQLREKTSQSFGRGGKDFGPNNRGSRGMRGAGRGALGGRGSDRGRGTRGRGRGGNMKRSFEHDEYYQDDYMPSAPAKRARGSASRGKTRPYNDYNNYNYGMSNSYEYDNGYSEYYAGYEGDYGEDYGGGYQQDYGYYRNQSSSYSQPQPPPSQAPPRPTFKDPFQSLAQSGLSSLETEEQAAKALEISNNLTQALLHYRMKNTPAEIQDKVKQQVGGNMNTGY